MTASRLIALRKKPQGIRPIAIGETWLRILGKLLLKTDPILREAFARNTAPTQYVGTRQFGVLTRCGVEAVAHTVREAVLTGRAVASLSLDFLNAYNIPGRARMAQWISRWAPSHFRMFEWTYRHEGSLFCTNKEKDIVRLASACGVRQGDVLAPLWYCIATRHILQQLEEELPLIEVFAYIDNVDILILAPPRSNDGELNIDHRNLPYDQPDRFVQLMCQRILQIVTNAAASIGARLQPQKSSLFALNPAHLHRCQDLGIQLTSQGTSILGVPIGRDEFVSQQAQQLLSSACHRSVAALIRAELPAQDKMLLLRNCIAPTPMYLARSISLTTSTHNIFGEWDEAMQQALKAILLINDISPTLIDLPTRLGGFGIRSMSNICTLAFSASLMQANAVLMAQTASTIHCTAGTMRRIWPFLQEVLTLFPAAHDANAAPVQSQIDNNTLPVCDLPSRRNKGIQSALTFHRDNNTANTFQQGLHPRLAPLYADSRACSAWLNIHPTNAYFELPDREFLTMARARALHEPTSLLGQCPLCHLTAPNANHIYTCRRFGEWRLSRHNFITRSLRSACPANTIYQALLTRTPAHSPVHSPPSSPSASPSSPSRTAISSSGLPYLTPSPLAGHLIADLLIRQGNRSIAVDVTVVSTRQIHVTHRDAELRAAQAKVTKYRPAILNGTIKEVVPFVVGPFGNIGEGATQFINTLSAPDPVRLRLNISIAAARATSRMILAWLSLAERVRHAD